MCVYTYICALTTRVQDFRVIKDRQAETGTRELQVPKDPQAHQVTSTHRCINNMYAGPPGAPGAAGNAGAKGPPGPAGERGICPKYCSLDGGIFFEDGTRRK
jgi:hypothetical protein